VPYRGAALWCQLSCLLAIWLTTHIGYVWYSCIRPSCRLQRLNLASLTQSADDVMTNTRRHHRPTSVSLIIHVSIGRTDCVAMTTWRHVLVVVVVVVVVVVRVQMTSVGLSDDVIAAGAPSRRLTVIYRRTTHIAHSADRVDGHER